VALSRARLRASAAAAGWIAARLSLRGKASPARLCGAFTGAQLSAEKIQKAFAGCLSSLVAVFIGMRATKKRSCAMSAQPPHELGL
jgi:hypothetical protein